VDVDLRWGVTSDQDALEVCREIVEECRPRSGRTKHHLMLDFHGAFKPDGMRRTFPNVLTREGVMGARRNRKTRCRVNAGTVSKLKLAPDGGSAIRLVPVR
jgi:hypothetical protein